MTRARKTLDEMLEYLARFRDGACPEPATASLTSPSQSPTLASASPAHNGASPV